MRSVQLIGNLTKNVELKKARNGGDVAKLRIAVNRGKRNGMDLGTDYFNITVFDGQARACYEYLEKGSKIGVNGNLRSSSYINRKNGIKVETVEIVAERIEFLSQRKADNDDEAFLIEEQEENQDMDMGLIKVEDEKLPFDTVAEDIQ